MIQVLRQPLISIQIDDRQQVFQPGDVLSAAFQIDSIEPAELRAIEISVLWFTEGTGEEDMAVHYFERLTLDLMPDLDLQQSRRFQTVLPNTPLSYEGVSVKICWCIRVRAFLRQGRDFVAERPFQLGNIPLAQIAPEAGG
ncbi:MAG TPA: hypothetical protein VGJ15_04465 [Pirellulales bacterium]